MAGSEKPHACSDAENAARKLAGRRIIRIERVLFEADGVVDSGDGPLELHLDDGSVLLLEGASDGESLRVKNGPWSDPFDGELSPENEKFIAECGKWTRVSVFREPPYDEMIGRRVSAVETLENAAGREAGVVIETDARTLWFVRAMR